MDLLQKYDAIKSEPIPQPTNLLRVGNRSAASSPGALQYRTQMSHECDKLKEGCSKRILLDIYCKILPLDSDYVAGNQGLMKQDIDNFLDNKGMTAQQYLKSCSEKTNAPLVEFVIRSINNIGKLFIEKAEEDLKDAQENNIETPAPEADAESEETTDQIVEIEKDQEYSDFIDRLKKKTIDRIVKDISSVINDKKSEKNMEFDLKKESAVAVSIDYLQNRLIKEDVDLDEDDNEQAIGMAIREATLNEIDKVFNQPNSDIRSFSSKIRFGKGVIINEAAVKDFFSKKGSQKQDKIKIPNPKNNAKDEQPSEETLDVLKSAIEKQLPSVKNRVSLDDFTDFLDDTKKSKLKRTWGTKSSK